ncbi:MAG: TIGR03943 family protein, partial [Desulfobacteraceae bacterium]
AWTGFLIYILASQRYIAFLRPEFGVLLALAYFIAMYFMFAAIIRPKTEEMDTSAVLRSLVLLVPVLYFVAMPDAILGNQAFKKRFIGTNNGAISRQAPSILLPQGAVNDPDVASPLEEIEGTQQETPQERTILDIFLNPNFYKGQRVIVTGMILRDDQLKPHFGGKDTAVYRFVINCCAADALPLAIALDSDKTDTFANDRWVQVDGIFDLQQINGKSVPMVSKPRIKPVKAPTVPYLF